MSENNYKDTLNMPQTTFDMRANLSTKEPEYRKKWHENKLYTRVLEKNKNNPSFILHDGPPYANGAIHIGHALNKILKDFIIRYKSMNGFYAPFIPGWDTHGLPIEHKMLQEAHLSHKSLPPLELRKKAKEYALKQVESQKSQFEQLQLLSDLEQKYITLDPNYVANQLKLFKKMVLSGLVYKGLKPVYWSPSSQSALAEAEVVYHDVISPSIYVAFEIKNNQNHSKINPGDKLIIWTTTPWTLLANAGVAVGENIAYILVEINDQKYIIAEELSTKMSQVFGVENLNVITKISALELKGMTYISPLNHNECPVVFGHHVNLESGSGLVHIAPLFGEDDFMIGNKNNLVNIMHVGDDGVINDEGRKYAGQFYEKANSLIIEELKNLKLLVYATELSHSYPHDWRTNKPILFRGTPQWFVSIEQIKLQIITALEKITTYPEWAKKRLIGMIGERRDWTISRQRTWGVPIIIFYDENQKAVIKEDIFDYVIKLVEENGADVWWEYDTDMLLPEEYRNKGYTREKDIMDVWFDSGSSFISIAEMLEHSTPFDLYLEGSDQYRGWFNSSVINSIAYSSEAPYKMILSHGFVLDGKGEKMSKSKGNTVDPLKVIQKHGADILRLWVANGDYTNDVTISEDILMQSSNLYRKLRNTIRFLLANLYDYSYDPSLKRVGVHAYIKEELEKIKAEVKEAYDEYKFMNVVKIINNYVVDLSSFYLNITKDILYIEKSNSTKRLMTQLNFYEIASFLIKAIAPILPTTAEDAYQNANFNNKVDSVHLENMDEIKPYDHEIVDKWQEFFSLRDEVNLLIEKFIQSGQIKRSNELKLTINTNSDFIKSLDLRVLLMVGQVEFGSETKAEVFESQKCVRCWNHYYVDQIKDNLCLLCYSIIKENDGK
ncbi:isoleucine--tRNA ligase [Mycoplasmopsis opalescens]|uniref:isoleucine--tRNA ligase n=1 Tax=Mycoplasmopsis opalescens TaxID=114886 RepID=UPI0004A718A5|nr:isoleucine--tRNA ligase [Mycoplasmopsis opalescens]